VEDIIFKRYLIDCPVCGKYEDDSYYESPNLPLTCKFDYAHKLLVSNLTLLESHSGFTPAPVKGEQYTKQFQNQHKSISGVSDFKPIIIEPEAGCKLVINQIDVIWNENLVSNSKVVWEIQILNPSFNSSLPVDASNPVHLIVAQFYYKNFSELWGGAHKRPISDGPTREMQHIFSDLNDKSNRNPFILYASMGMRIYSYSTDDIKHADGEGTQYNTVGGTKFYIPYLENTKDSNGLYSLAKASSYPVGFDTTTVKECDDVYTFNAIGSIFPEV